MADFNLALPKVLNYEGPYDLDPDDPGGETCFGIDRASNPGWAGWMRIAALKALPGFPGSVTHDIQIQSFVASFYESLWNTLRLTEVKDQALAECIYNGCINQGSERTVKWLQYCINAVTVLATDLIEDGKIGQDTIDRLDSTVSQDTLDLVLTLLKAQRQAAYIETAHNRPASRKYIKGWTNRLAAGG